MIEFLVSPVLAEVQKERERQDGLWGQQNHKPLSWLPILAEEFGEVSKEICDFEAHKDSVFGYSLYNYRAELLQVAAVAVAMVEALDRGNT